MWDNRRIQHDIREIVENLFRDFASHGFSGAARESAPFRDEVPDQVHRRIEARPKFEFLQFTYKIWIRPKPFILTTVTVCLEDPGAIDEVIGKFEQTEVRWEDLRHGRI